MNFLTNISCFYVLLILQSVMAIQNWKLIGTKTPEEIQQNEVYALLDRIQDKLSLKFNISIQPQTEDETSTQCSKNSDLIQERPFQKILISVDFIVSL